MTYDDASWHYGGKGFDASLPIESGGTHIAMFVSWCVLNEMGRETHYDDFHHLLDQLVQRKITPGAWFMSACDGKFWDEDLNADGNAFASAYYDFDKGMYIHDYNELLAANVASEYHVSDTWENYEVLAPRILARYKELMSLR